jgi:S-DNA-T family DNA segregation ATPase FtsK/SpoIIIE
VDVILTAVNLDTAASIDLRVTGPDSSPAAEVCAALAAAVGSAPGTPVQIDGRAVPIDGTALDCGLFDGAVVQVGLLKTGEAPVRASLRRLVVGSGPAAGRHFDLRPGEYLVGRGPHCDITIEDPSISREHLRLHVSAAEATASVRVVDLGTANGTRLAGQRIDPRAAAMLAVGDRLTAGDSELRLAASNVGRGLSGTRDVAVLPPPQLDAPGDLPPVVFPSLPEPAGRTPLPVLASTAPLVAGLILAVALHQLEVLAFTVLSPLMLGAQAAADWRSRRRTAKEALRSYRSARTSADVALVAALRAEEARLRESAPDLGVLTEAADLRSPPLWQRRLLDTEAMTVRLGVADLPSEISVTGGPQPMSPRAPVRLHLREAWLLGLTGPDHLVRGLARSIILQIAMLHPPGDLRIVILAPASGDGWTWARWIPHVRAAPLGGLGLDDEQVADLVTQTANLVTQAADLATARASAADANGESPQTLVLIDACDAADRRALVEPLLGRAGPFLTVVWCAQNSGTVPARCSAVAALSADPVPRLRLSRRDRPAIPGVVPDLVAADVATETARALAPLRTASGGSVNALPTTVGWEDLIRLDLVDVSAVSRALARRWSHGPSMRVPLGAGRTGPVIVDLAADGPHTLIAGTTGSGKSELLLGLMASLVAANRPDDLALLLIDHKGGATFGPCAAFPHTTGVVTDLDGESTTRALRSLAAEVRRREKVLAAAGVTDIASYPSAQAHPAEPLPRLVVAVDEFATMAEEHSDFIGGLVAIARRGRSLGIHLVLATQRPGGSVSADIRANTRLRICLAVAADGDSADVIDSPIAARLGAAPPGRGYVRASNGELREFQASYLGGPRPPATVTAVAAPVELAGSRGLDRPSRPHSDAVRTLGLAAQNAAAKIGCAPPHPSWLPPLPAGVTLSSLLDVAGSGTVPWAITDLPAEGTQHPLCLELDAPGAVVVAGAARSGRTTAARAIATALATRCSPDDLHLWVLDSGGDLADLSGLPHCGSVIPTGDQDRVDRLITYLADDVGRRSDPTGANATHRVVVVDSWEGLTSQPDGGRLGDAVLRLAADGPSTGLHVIITSDRSGLVGRLGSVATEKVALRLADPGDYALLGLPSREVPARMPPGRGIRARDRSTVQVAEPDRIALKTATSWSSPTRPARSFASLPDTVALADLITAAGAVHGAVLLGVGMDEIGAIRLTRSDIGAGFLIAGPTGSGRSNALEVLARQLVGTSDPDSRLAVSAPIGSALLDLPDVVVLPRDDPEHALALLDALTATTGATPDILVDDADQLDEGPFSNRLEDLLRQHSDRSVVLVMAADVDRAALSFRGPLALARPARTGLLLAPSPGSSAQMYGVRLPHRPHTTDPPGRGVLIRGDAWVPVQVAMSERGPGVRALAGRPP